MNAIGVAVFAVSCNAAPPEITMVAVDTSGTRAAADSTIFLDSFEAVTQSFESGDRLVLGRINGQSVSDFNVDFDLALPRTGVVLDDRDAHEAGIAGADAAFRQLLHDRTAEQSNVLAVLAVAGEIFARDSTRARKSLVLLSDMRNESRELNLSTRSITPAFTEQFIADQRAKGGLPKLEGVRVQVAGAGARDDDAASFAALKAFWIAYLAASGAHIDPSDYGRTAIPAEE
jgi:hypothetical protein